MSLLRENNSKHVAFKDLEAKEIPAFPTEIRHHHRMLYPEENKFQDVLDLA
jgi:hypothetical protein